MCPPKDHHDTFNEIRHAALDRISEIRQNAHTAEDHIHAVLGTIEQTTERYRRTGLCVIPPFLNACWDGASYLHGSPRGYFRSLSTLWNRPFLCAESYGNNRYPATQWWEISIPKNKRTDKLAVPLLLASNETTVFSTGGSGWGLDSQTLYQDSTNGTWKFYVHDHNKMKFVGEFETHCYTNPICRIILNLAGIPKP